MSVGNHTTVFLNARDMNTFSREIVSNVVARSVIDDSYIDKGDEVSAKALVMQELTQHKTLTTELAPHLWESVFWDPDNARPDKVTNYMNKVFDKDQGKTQHIKVKKRELEGSMSGKFKVNLMKLVEFGGESSQSGKIKNEVSVQDVREWLREHRYEVEWTGEKFAPKALDLHRVNIGRFTSGTEIVSTSVQVHKYEMIHSTQVTALNPQQNLAGSHQNINQRIDTIISDLRAGDDLLLRDIQDVNQTLATHKSYSDLKLAKINSNGWSVDQFCILSNGGSCPDDSFTRHDVHHRVEDHTVPNGVQLSLEGHGGSFGDSKIWKGFIRSYETLDLDLYVCCK